MIDKIKNILERDGKYWIAFVGDSITSCEWVHPNWREIVEYVLKDKLQNEFSDWRIPSWGIRCFNCGYDGATTRDVLEKIGEIEGLDPDLVIMMLGGNDPAKGISVEEYLSNIEKISTELESIDCFLMTDIKPFNGPAGEKYEPYTKAKGVFDMFGEWKKYEREEFFTFKSEENPAEGIKKGDRDFWHPNQLGNAYIAKIILKEVFGIEFDPEKYWQETLRGEKYPGY